MNASNIIGVDIGGTNVRAAAVNHGSLSKVISERLNSGASSEQVLYQIFEVIDQIIDPTVMGIGIGVPGLVDMEQELVFDVINIPSWDRIPLKKLVEERYKIPVAINNDANCFALGEFYFGKGRRHDSMIGLTIGTGLGSGIIIDKKLYVGKTGGAGEFGMMEYLDKFYEYYASGQFFQNKYRVDGEAVFKLASSGDHRSIAQFAEMGGHLGNAIKAILYAYDVDRIILGGSVRHAYQWFSESMWAQIRTFAYKRTIDSLSIEISELENSGILGAAALHYDS